MLQKRYEGFLKTPLLWKSEAIAHLIPFEIISKFNKIDIEIDEKLRLGKYVERLVFFQLEQQNHISILAENIQIQKDKITLGELDCLLLKNNKPIHLEIIYKFYVYDASVGNSEIEHFIGPNRKDALTEKLTKLKNKQLPLLYTDTCKKYLDALGVKSENIIQQVYFKAQLFVPLSQKKMTLKTLNNDCIVGFYISQNQLESFNTCKFYIPTKRDWLVIPHTNVDWLNFNAFKKSSEAYFSDKFSTLCWIKFNNGELKKVFLVWW